MITAQVLGTAEEAELKLVCGVVKIKLTGVMLCQMLPGLVNLATTSNLEIVCKNNAKFDGENGECTVLCADLGALGLKANFGGETTFDAFEELTLKGKLNKDVFIDD